MHIGNEMLMFIANLISIANINISNVPVVNLVTEGAKNTRFS